MEHRYNQSLHGWYRNISRVVKNGNSVFLRRPNGNSYEDILFKECDIQINAISAWLVENGFKKGDRLGFLMDNCPEYLLVDQGLMQIGGVNVSVYPTLAENDAAYILNDSQCKFLFVGSAFLMKKALKIIDQVPSLIKIISLIEDKSQNNRIINYKSLIEEGKALYPARKEEIEKVFEQVKRDDICTLIYTSGTTGVPKGVMLSHGNIMSNAESGVSMIKFIDHRDSYLSFLPLSHVFERMATYGISLYCGCEISFAQSIDTIAKNILEIKPSVMATVPRLLERIEARVKKNALSGRKYKVAIFNWAVSVGNEARILREDAKSYPFILKLKLAIAEKLVFSKIKARLGGKMRILISGGAALPQHVGEFFANIGVRILEGYGLTETSPVITVNEFDRQIIGTVGRVMPGITVKIQNPENGQTITIQDFDSFDPNFECAEGEICVKGPNIMKGYWNKEEDTKAVFDEEGWFHTGDIGKFYKGHLKITDRIKNMLVNAFGKNIYPTPVESAYLQSYKIEQIFLIGDKREYISALIVPSKDEIKEKFGKGDTWFDEGDFINDEEILDWVEGDIKSLGNQLAKFERIKNFKLKKQPFSIEKGEITPTLKTRRKVIEKLYSKEIEEMYQEQD